MSRIDWTDDKLLSRLQNNQTDRSRWDIIGILRKRPSEELFATCVAFTKSDSPKIRQIGIDILAQLGLPPRPFLNETLKICFELLEVETDPGVIMALLYAIGHNNSELNQEQIEKICSLRENENPLVKEGLVSAVLGIDNTLAIETLVTLSSDKRSHIRNWATFGLGSQIDRNNKIIREALWERVNDKHPETKLEAIAGLAKRKDKRVNDIIKRELINAEFGTLLFEAIIETKDKTFLPFLKQHLKAVKDDKTTNPEWEKALKHCINELTELADK